MNSRKLEGMQLGDQKWEELVGGREDMGEIDGDTWQS